MSVKITLDYEFLDVISAFPVVRRTLVDDLHLNLSDINDGETMRNYFLRKSFKPEEIRIILRKLNHKVNSFLNKPLSMRDYESRASTQVEEEEE